MDDRPCITVRYVIYEKRQRFVATKKSVSHRRKSLFISLFLCHLHTAERNKVENSILTCLQEHGGKVSSLAKIEAKGELFGSAPDAARKSQERRQKEKDSEQEETDRKAAELEAKNKALEAQSAMGQAFGALQERGQKIEDLGEKANELENQTKTFGELAARLKSETKKKKKWYQL
jgi:hypothetical protein